MDEEKTAALEKDLKEVREKAKATAAVYNNVAGKLR